MIYQVQNAVQELFSTSKEEISFVLLPSGLWRNEELFRTIALFLRSGAPLCVARWYLHPDNTRVLQQWEVLKALEEFQAPAGRGYALAEIGEQRVIFEEYLNGLDLNTLVTQSLLPVKNSLDIARSILNELHRCSERPSTEEALKEELATLLSFAEHYRLFAERTSEVCSSLQTNVITALSRHTPIRTCLVHFDFTLNNIVNEPKGARAFDFEFTRRSHFFFCDWFRLFSHSPALHGHNCFDYALPENIQMLCSDNDWFRAILTVTALSNLQTRLSITPRNLWIEILDSSRAELARLFFEAKRPHSVQNSVQNNVQSTSAIDLMVDSGERPIASSMDDRSEQLATALIELQRNYEGSLRALSNVHSHHRETLEAERTRHREEIKTATEQLAHRLLAAETLLANTDQQIEVYRTIAADREALVRNVNASLAFRLGQAMTTPLKMVPGAKRLRAILRHS